MFNNYTICKRVVKNSFLIRAILTVHFLLVSRYKVVIVMSIVQKLGQDVHIGFGKLWDVQKDTYSTHVIETPEFAAMGLVVGTYYE